MKKGFGMADRFLYVKIAERLATCQPNLSPANYNHHAQHKKMTEYPCTTVIKKLGISREDQINYKYIGHSLVYDPIKLISPELDRTRLAVPGNRGIFTHPELRMAGARTTRHVSTTRTRGRVFNF